MMTDFLFVSVVHETVELLCLHILSTKQLTTTIFFDSEKKYKQTERTSGKHCELEDFVKNYTVSITFLM